MEMFLSSVRETLPLTRSNEHGGTGEILFRRLLDSSGVGTAIDFVDYTIVPPGSVIGRHEHVGNEELYFIIEGKPVIRINTNESRLEKGSISVVRNGQSHELINDTNNDVIILVIQVRI